MVNNPETRRRLRLDLQKELIDSNGDIISQFGKVAEQLRRIGTTIGKLNASFAEMKTEIAAANSATGDVLKEASSLVTQRRQVETKQRLLKSVNDHFLLSEDEVALLTLSSEPVDEAFFDVLSKAKKISQDCELLLGFENQTLGLEIMEQTTKYINLAFQKLYRWIQREFKTLNLENPQMGTSIRHALRVLAERPSLFQSCLDYFAEAREHILSDAFHTALTGESPSGKPDPSVKPIELAAHDLLRYVGDMLAWMHSAAVGEREALEVFFVSDGGEIAAGLQAGRENEVWRLADDEDSAQTQEFDAVAALNELVDRDMSGAVRVLRQRVEQVVQTNEETILAYKLANLLNFYRETFNRLLGPKAVLAEALGNLESEAMRQFRSLMRDHIAALQGDFQHTPADLGLPDFLRDALDQLAAIMKTYDTSLSSSLDREADFQPILTEALDPFLSGCENIGKSVPNPDDFIFLINCYEAARDSLSRYEFAQNKTANLQTKIDEEARKLVESQYTFFRTESGLDGLMESLLPLTDSPADIAKVKTLEAAKPSALTKASQMLDDFLPSALMDAMENLNKLLDARLARNLTEEAAERFCTDFEHVEEMLILADEVAEEEADEDAVDDIVRLRALFPRTSGEIRVLLS